MHFHAALSGMKTCLDNSVVELNRQKQFCMDDVSKDGHAERKAFDLSTRNLLSLKFQSITIFAAIGLQFFVFNGQ